MLERLKKLPIEVWALTVLPGFFLVYIFATSKIGFHYFLGSVESGYLDYFLLFIPPHTLPAIIVLTLYASARTLIWIGLKLATYFTRHSLSETLWLREMRTTITQNVAHMLLYLFMIATASLALVCKLLYLGTSSAERVANTSLQLMQFDLSVFGVYLPFWLQGHSWSALADSVSLEAYMLLTTVLTITILGLIALRGKRHFRALVLSFFLASVIATPIWMTFPAVTPNELFRENVLNVDTTSPVATYALAQSTKINTKTSTLLTSVETLQSRPDISHWHVPTFPSMHVAWGLIFVYFGFVIAWPLGLILVAWWLLNITGAVLSLQHYGVDVILGTAVGLAAIASAYFLLQLEKQRLSVPQNIYSFLDTIYHDLNRLNTFVTSKLTFLSKK